MFFDTTKKLSIDVESLHFRMFSAKRREFKIKKEIVMENHKMVMENYIIKSVGSLVPEQLRLKCTCILDSNIILAKS